MMTFLQMAKERCSMRKYQPRAVEKEKLAKILEAGRIAPTGANRQPFRVLVASSEEGLAKVAQAANVYGAPLVLVVCGDVSRGWVRPNDGHNIYEIDTTIATDHMMLEAADLGLDSVWICWFDVNVLRDVFNIPENLVPVNILAIGYGEGKRAAANRHDDFSHKASARKPLDELVVYESF